MAKRKSSCQFCKSNVVEVDYKDYETLRNFLTQRGKIVSRRSTGLCAYHQRSLSKAIKRARIMGLLPFVETYYL